MNMYQFLLVIFLSFSYEASANPGEGFLKCLSLRLNHSSIAYTRDDSSYTSILNSSVQNFRFSVPSTPTPLIIITPSKPSHIQATIYCSRKQGLQVRTRSGGHDFEGLSYTSKNPFVPFVLIDLVNLRSIDVDIEKKVAWVESGATVGEMYYKIAKRSSTLAFPGAIGLTIGIGGYLSGGGYGAMFRKYGLAADNVIDARLIDAKGRILDRKAMGEDVFWAIRGGGGGNFGIVISWKVKLVPVPVKVTSFSVTKTLEQNATKLIHRWQSIAHKFPKEVGMSVVLTATKSNQDEKKMTIQAIFGGSFLGTIDKLIPLMQQRFPELGLVEKDCLEMRWVESTLYSYSIQPGQPLEALLVRSIKSPLSKMFYKAKSDSVKQPIPEKAFEGLWPKFYEAEAKSAVMVMVAYGGRMDEIPETETPYPHRTGNLYTILYVVDWEENENVNADKFISWMRGVYDYMTPFVSKSPREAYVNYRDLDIGTNSDNYSYENASVWGRKYFKNNFNRLVHVKTTIDPENFFRNEQSIPPFSSVTKEV